MDVEELRNKWNAAVVARNKAQQAVAEFNAAMSQARAELVVPDGYSIDFLDDGKVRPEAECRKVSK